MIKQKLPKSFALDIDVRVDFEEYINTLIVPHRLAPVIIADEQGGAHSFFATAMKFALLPSWAKEPKVKFATHNARLETLAEKPTWRGPLKSRHCVIPFTDFIEPIYTGDLAGNMVSFHEPGRALLYAAGLWDEWVNTESGEVIQSFTIITGEPPEFVANTGHDRCPIFLTENSISNWLSDFSKTNAEHVDWLLANRATALLSVEKFRPLKAGWEKRIPS